MKLSEIKVGVEYAIKEYGDDCVKGVFDDMTRYSRSYTNVVSGGIEVRRNERGAWCVYIDGRMISDHRDHEAARIAALRHMGIDADRGRL